MMVFRKLKTIIINTSRKTSINLIIKLILLYGQSYLSYTVYKTCIQTSMHVNSHAKQHTHAFAQIAVSLQQTAAQQHQNTHTHNTGSAYRNGISALGIEAGCPICCVRSIFSMLRFVCRHVLDVLCTWHSGGGCTIRFVCEWLYTRKCLRVSN